MTKIAGFEEQEIDDWLVFGIEHIYRKAHGRKIGQNNRAKFIRRLKTLEHLIIEGTKESVYMKPNSLKKIFYPRPIKKAFSYELLGDKYCPGKVYFAEEKRKDKVLYEISKIYRKQEKR